MTDDGLPLILGDFYQGAHGPTIILEAQTLLGVDWFRRVLVKLSRDEEANFDLVSKPEMRIDGVDELKVETVPVQPDIPLTRTAGSGYESAGFLWRQDTLRWAHASMLIEPMLKGRPGHQYLTNEGRDAALVEFSHGEDLGLGNR
ncbi:MAG: hypothetical protein JSS68_04650 [Actinobacteria bacterium]|nr:hypothetical protein [Actinomycetota bacterium]